MSETSSSKTASVANKSTPTKLSSNVDNNMVDSAVDDNFHSGNNNSCKKQKSTAGEDVQKPCVVSSDGASATTTGYGNDNNNDKPMAGNKFPHVKTSREENGDYEDKKEPKQNKRERRETPVHVDDIPISNIQTWPEYVESNDCSKKIGCTVTPRDIKNKNNYDARKYYFASNTDVGEKPSATGRIAGEHGKTYSVNHDINKKISLHKGDITKLKVDVIVNAANSSLLGGGGVDGAIHKAAGPELKEKCQSLHGCNTGDIVKTEGYCLPAKHIIHTVGPMGEKADKLRNCYLKSLKSLSKDERTIAFPCISTGIYGYPNDKAAEVSLDTVRNWMESNHERVDRVIFCIFLDKDIEIYKEKMQKYFPLTETRDSVVVGNVEDNSQAPANAEFQLNKDSKKTPVTTNQQSYKG